MTTKANMDRAANRTRFQLSDGAATYNGAPRVVLRDNDTNLDYAFSNYTLAQRAVVYILANGDTSVLISRPASLDAYHRVYETLENIELA